MTQTLAQALVAALGVGVMMETKIAGKVLTIDPAKLPDAAILDLLRYGTQRRFNDATGGSDKTDADKWAKAQEMIDGYYEGILSTRKAGDGASALTIAMRQEAQKWAKQNLKKDDYKARITDVEDGERNGLLDKIIAKAPELFEEQAKEALALKAKEKARIAAMGKAISFEL